MKLFWGNKKSGELNNAVHEFNDKSVTGWDSIGEEVPFNNVTDAARQKRKVIASLLYGYQHVGDYDVNLPEGAEETFARELDEGHIDSDRQKQFLQTIADPVSLKGEEVISNSLGNDKHSWKIIGFALDGADGFNNYTNMMRAGTLQEFMRRYPTPIDLENAADVLVDSMRRSGSSEQKIQEYERDLKKFQNKIYGKRWEYYERLKELEAENDKEVFDVESCSDEESREILGKSLINGDPFPYLDKSYLLTPDILEYNDLGPRRKIMFEGTEIGLSNSYRCDGHDAVVGYVKTDEGYKVRSYYRSNSQGSWRYLPEYVPNPGSNHPLEWFGKGYNEAMLTLPCEMQVALNQVMQDEKANIKTVPEFILAGTAKLYNSKYDFIMAKAAKELRGDVYEEADSSPVVDFGALDDPNRVVVGERESPNFKKELIEWDSMTGMYGHLKNRVYKSYNGKLKYTFSEDDQGRAFISNIETNGKITSAGIRKEWVLGGGVEMPLYEYKSQDNGYGDDNDMKGGYVCMWKGYLSKMKIIQDYLNARQK